MIVNTSACQGARMDAENHFKNRAMVAENQQHGASLKSQMSKGNFLKIVCALIIACFVFSGCNDNDNDDDNDTINKIIATVEDGAKYNGQIVTVKFMVEIGDNDVAIATGNWSNGGFTIDLPETVEANHLRTLDRFAPSVTVSNNNAKGVFWTFIGGFDVDDRRVDYFYNIKGDNNSTTWVEYIYVDMDVNITGTFSDDEETRVYSLSLKKGWNITYRTWIRGTGVTERSSTAVSGLKWHSSRDFWGNDN